MNGPDRYYRVSPRIWLESWDDDMRLVAFYILTSPHRTTEGLFRMPLEYGASDMGWTVKRFERAFNNLWAEGFVEYDADASVCLIVNALRYQAPQNPNQRRGAAKAIRALPETGLLNRFLTLAERFAEPFAKELAEALDNGSGNGSPNQSLTLLTPCSKPPLTPPAGGNGNDSAPAKVTSTRRRDREQYERDLASWAGRHFPESRPDAVAAAVSTLRSGSTPVTAGDVRALAASQPVWAEQLGLAS